MSNKKLVIDPFAITDDKKLRSIAQEDRYVFLYLLCVHARCQSSIGIDETAEELGLDTKVFMQCVSRLHKTGLLRERSFAPIPANWWGIQEV